MTKTIVLGIDSLDPYVLSEYKAALPNFARLMDASPTSVSYTHLTLPTNREV